MKLDIFDYKTIRPFDIFGLTGKFWAINLDTLVYTWIAMFVLLSLALCGRHIVINKKHPIISSIYEKAIGVFVILCTETFGFFNFKYFAFITAIFLFTLSNCLVGLIPLCDEATKDLNTTLAIGSMSFLYIQGQKIFVHGIWGYIKEFFQPIFLLAPVHVVGELAKVTSMSFRLFGNILGGGIIFVMLVELLECYKFYFMGLVYLLALFSVFLNFFVQQNKYLLLRKIINTLFSLIFIITWIQIGFGICEGLIQSFVITMLSMTYLAIGIQSESYSDNEHNVPAQVGGNL